VVFFVAFLARPFLGALEIRAALAGLRAFFVRRAGALARFGTDFFADFFAFLVAFFAFLRAMGAPPSR
jgi:hypothetical protein